MRDRRKWTPEEDKILRREVLLQQNKGHSKQWNQIAESLAGRTNKDCRKRWAKLGNNLNKGAWSGVEDEKLKDAIQELGCRWTEVAKRVGTRHAEQCAKRWQNSLDPTVDHSKWEEDDEKLLGCVEAYGRNWTKIRDLCFPNRSTTDLKNRYTMCTRKQQRVARSSITNPGPIFAMELDNNEESELEDEMEGFESPESSQTPELSSMSQSSPFTDPIPSFISDEPHMAPSGQNEIIEFDCRENVASDPHSYTGIENSDIFLFPSENDFFWGDDNLSMQLSMVDPLWCSKVNTNANSNLMTSSSGDSALQLQCATNSETAHDEMSQTITDINTTGGQEGVLSSYYDFEQFGKTESLTSDSSRMESESILDQKLTSQTTLILDDVHPQTLKNVMHILIETNTKMTMRRYQ